MEAYQKTFSQIQHELSVNDQGLSPKEALIRMQKYGKNEIIASKQPSVFSIFIDQFKDLLVIILIVAALISALRVTRKRRFTIKIMNSNYYKCNIRDNSKRESAKITK